jgi:glycosyltransferase involved in cell wall biosynthesis
MIQRAFGDTRDHRSSMRVLFITFYYPPDLSAGSFRAAALVEALVARGAEVQVLTSSPNRYASTAAVATDDTAATKSGVTITRISVPAHRSGILDQIKTFSVFAMGAWRAVRWSDTDLILATSSRLLSASLGALIAKRLCRPLYLDIRDIFSETVSDVFGRSLIRLAMPFVSALEKWTLRSARRINLVSPPFADYFEAVVGHRDFALFTNGVDDLFLRPLPMPRKGPKTRAVVLAAGNIGEGQGLHHIVPALARAYPDVTFRIIGDGGRRDELRESIATVAAKNVELIDPMARDKLLQEYSEATILFLHLNDLPAFRRVLPSKMFEYAATGKPVLAGVAGYARELLHNQVAGVAIFDPCNCDAAVHALGKLLVGPPEFDRSTFTRRFERHAIMAAMAEDIESTLCQSEHRTAADAGEGNVPPSLPASRGHSCPRH